MKRGEQIMWTLREPKALLTRRFPTKQMQKLGEMKANGPLRTRTKLLQKRRKRGEVNHDIVYRHGYEPVRGRGESKRCVSRRHLLWFRKASQSSRRVPQAMRGARHAGEHSDAFFKFRER